MLEKIDEEQLNQEPEQLEDVESKFGFQLGELGLILDTHINKEVIAACEVCKLQTPNQWIEGFINVRSQIIPLINLSKLFNLPRTSNTGFAYILILGIGEKKIAVPVDQYPIKVPVAAPEIVDADLKETHPILAKFVQQQYHFQVPWYQWQFETFITYLKNQ